MPVLTDRQEPEDYNQLPNSDDPNDYAIRYLFNSNRPTVEFKRTGQTLLYGGVAINGLSFLLYAAWLELNFDPWLLGMALLLLALSGLTAIAYYQKRPTALVGAVLPLLLVVGVLISLLFNPYTDQAGFFSFFLPGSLVLAASLFLLKLGQEH